MTNERKVAVQFQINYYRAYYPSAEELGFGSASGPLPTGDREIQMQFAGGRPHSELRYAVLFGQGAAEINPIAEQKERLSVGNPGSIISADCTSPQTMGVTQILYGQVKLDPQGTGSVDTIGRLRDQHVYLSDGTDRVVGLLDIVPPVTDIEPPGRIGQGCTLRLPDWPYLGGTLWHSPSALSGEVTVGSVGSNYRVDSAVPPLANSSSLSWTVRGPTAINYTLTDTLLEHRQALEEFWAGILAALATGFAVEVINVAIGIFEPTSSGDSEGTLTSSGGSDSASAPKVQSLLIRIVAVSFVITAITGLVRRLLQLRRFITGR